MAAVAEIPAGVITSDACIIEDQTHHLIVALRLPKSTIAANHALMLALSERTVPQSSPQPRPASFSAPGDPSSRKSRYASMAFLAAGCAAVFAIAAPTKTGAWSKPPVVYNSLKITSPVVAPDTEIVLAMRSHRSRLCRTDVERVFFSMPDEIPVYRIRLQGTGQALTPEPIERINKIPLPKGLADGHYAFMATTFSDCGPGDQHATSTEKLAFEVRQ
jgi:hypothetical protein